MTMTPQLTKAERRAAAREQAAIAQAETAARERRTRNILWSIIGVAIAALIGLGVWLFSHGGGGPTSEAVTFDPVPVAEVANVPGVATADHGIAINTALAASNQVDANLPTVGVFLDYMCPACLAFENLNFETLTQMAESGEANVVMHPIAILDRASLGTTYSTRAAAAAWWLAERAPEAFMPFHDLMFQNQPSEGSAGMTNAQIADLARQAGAPEDVAEGIADGTAANTYGEWATAITHDAGNTIENFRGTPTIVINGQIWEGNWTQDGELRNAVIEAGA